MKKKKTKKKLEPIDKNFIQKNSFWKPKLEPAWGFVESNSWFDITQSNENSLIEPTEQKGTTECIRAKPIHITPTLKQREILLQWLEIYRQVYNITVDYFKTNKVISFINARKIIDVIIEENSYLTGLCEKYLIPKHTRDNAIKDVIKAYKTAYANKKAGNILNFKLRYKKSSKHIQTLVLEDNTFSKKKNIIAYNCFKKLDPNFDDMKTSEPLTDITKECKLSFNSRTKKFTLWVPYDKITNYNLERNKVVSLDPGVRTFQTCYSSDGIGFEISTNEVFDKVSYIRERIENVKCDTGKNYNKFLVRLREKLTNVVKDLHYKTALFLCENFDKILIGNMSTTGILNKGTSKLTNKTKRKCLAQSHYTFREILKSKAQEYNVEFILADESYTSKTCGGCGEINNELGSKKTFNCNNCPFKMDRDYNGARNILLKYLSKQK